MPYNIFNAAKDLATGNMQYANEEKKKARLAICKKCEFLGAPMPICKKCGCVVPGKVMLEKSSCPLKLW